MTNIGIYLIFIGKYTVFYKDCVESIIRNFLPDYRKTFYVVTDDRSLPSYGDTEFFYTEYIGWPYETLYRFKYFLQFRHIRSDIIYFFNGNARCVKPIGGEVLPDNYGFVFTKHWAYQNTNYYHQTLEKNELSTAFIPPMDTTYIGGGFFGATKNNFIILCKKLDENITTDERKKYIAIWHDESHLNRYFNIELHKNAKLLDVSYHVPGHYEKYYKDIKIIYLHKQLHIEKLDTIKGNSEYGNIIPNKYNKEDSQEISNHKKISFIDKFLRR
jgi:hypothetical protein